MATAHELVLAAAVVSATIGLRISLRRRASRLQTERLSSKQVDAETPLVVVVGLGGVGSHAAHLLLRGGVRRLRLVDFDQVTLSSLNRHATATRRDVGTTKAYALRAALLRIEPGAQIEAMVALFNASSADAALADSPALVIDAIDDLDTKALLLASCVSAGLQVLCALGAGGKAHAGELHLTKLEDAVSDPIATTLLRNFRKAQAVAGAAGEALEQDWPQHICCVACSEKQRVALLPLPADVQRADELGSQPNFRVRVMPVLPPLPAAFGAALAAHGLRRLRADRAPLAPTAVAPITAAYQRKLFVKFQREVLARSCDAPSAGLAWPLSYDDVLVLVCDVFRCRCALSGLRMQDPSRPQFCLTLLDPDAPPALTNVLFATVTAAAQHRAAGLTAVEPRVLSQIKESFEAALCYRPHSLFYESLVASASGGR